MKLMNMTITAMIFFALSLTTAEASTRQVGGLIIGGGTGAIVGQAVGRNTESTIVGAAVGGVVGLIIGSELDRHHGAVKQPARLLFTLQPIITAEGQRSGDIILIILGFTISSRNSFTTPNTITGKLLWLKKDITKPNEPCR